MPARQHVKQYVAASRQADRDLAQQRQMLAGFAQGLPRLALAGLLIAIAVAVGLLLGMPDPGLSGWLAFLLLAQGALWLASRFYPQPVPPEDRFWPRLFLALLATVGAAWGGLLLWLPEALFHSGLLMLLGLLILAAPLSAWLRFGLTALGLPPLLLALWHVSSGPADPAMVLALLLLATVLLLSDAFLHRRLRTRLELQAGRRLLESHLQDRNREMLKQDLRLQREIGARTQAEERFRRFSEAASEGVIIHDAGVIIDVNECLTTLVGRSSDELIGTSWPGLISEAHRPRVRACLDSASDKPLRCDLLGPQQVPCPVLLQNRHLPVGEMSLQVVTIKDMRRELEIENALLQEKERALVTLESIGDSVVTTDADGLITYVNPVCEQLTGWPRQEATGKYLADIMRLVDKASGQVLTDPVITCLVSEQRVSLNQEIVLRGTRSEREYSIEVMITPLQDAQGQLIGTVLVFHDVTLLRAMAEQMSHQASHDALTGLINRQEFEQRLNTLLGPGRDNSRQHAMCYLDLDEFKVVNDTSGHAAGDRLLRELAERLQECVRDSDILARLGGDEFGALLVGCPLAKAEQIANQMREVVRAYRMSWEDRIYSVGVSIGLVPVSGESGSVTDVLRAADSACYVAKDQGRNRVHVYQENDAELARHHSTMRWMQKIQRALEQDHFRLMYQPVRDAAHCRIDVWHAEFLLRMVDREGELIGPDKFIPAAERYHLMANIDRWVIEHACAAIPVLARNLAPRKVLCAINLSGQSLSDDAFLAFLVDRIDAAGVDPASLCFEITETAAISNIDHAQRFISVLRGMGCEFALDDFGSGLSSFSYLKRLPVDYLKIDGSFVRNMLEDDTDYAMVKSIQQIGAVMGIRTIAEFVETEAIAQALNEIGVDLVQGYGVGRPAPLRELMTDPASAAEVMPERSAKAAADDRQEG